MERVPAAAFRADGVAVVDQVGAYGVDVRGRRGKAVGQAHIAAAQAAREEGGGDHCLQGAGALGDVVGEAGVVRAEAVRGAFQGGHEHGGDVGLVGGGLDGDGHSHGEGWRGDGVGGVGDRRPAAGNGDGHHFADAAADGEVSLVALSEQMPRLHPVTGKMVEQVGGRESRRVGLLDERARGGGDSVRPGARRGIDRDAVGVAGRVVGDGDGHGDHLGGRGGHGKQAKKQDGGKAGNHNYEMGSNRALPSSST